MAIDGLMTIRSSFGHRVTLDRFKAVVRANGLRVVADVDHARAASATGNISDSATVLMIGDGRRQVALMQAVRLIALELPFRVLIWESDGAAWLSYADFRWLARRYGVGVEHEYLVTELTVMYDGIVRKAASPP